jgi:hypothetical protein
MGYPTHTDIEKNKLIIIIFPLIFSRIRLDSASFCWGGTVTIPAKRTSQPWIPSCPCRSVRMYISLLHQIGISSKGRYIPQIPQLMVDASGANHSASRWNHTFVASCHYMVLSENRVPLTLMVDHHYESVFPLNGYIYICVCLSDMYIYTHIILHIYIYIIIIIYLFLGDVTVYYPFQTQCNFLLVSWHQERCSNYGRNNSRGGGQGQGLPFWQEVGWTPCSLRVYYGDIMEGIQ